jgi:hypothetical protein
MDRDDREARFTADLLARVTACGVGEDHVGIRYEDVLQSHVVRIEGGPLTANQVQDLMDATWARADLEFADPANTGLYHDAMQRAGARIVEAQAAELLSKHPDFPRFDPRRRTLSEYAEALEAYCGFAPGAALSVVAGRLTIGPLKGPLDQEQSRRLYEMTIMAVADDRVGAVLVGYDGGDPPA